jgi:CRISPR/Cas system type I-B associated protein Csh2 (Cas7 group RAMP superfamily)
MAARFAVVTEEEIAQIKEDSIPKKPKQATKYGLKIFQGKILNFYLEKTGFVATRHKAVSEI